ncbi:hypothetical protein GJ496_011527 [Pomphorhynchus laevis]|nr:hypothetical protein GJ496_011527 [Pomphorhynchus laevis]
MENTFIQQIIQDQIVISSISVLNGNVLLTGCKIFGYMWYGKVAVTNKYDVIDVNCLKIAASCGDWVSDGKSFIIGKDNGQIEHFTFNHDTICLSKSVQHFEHQSPVVSICIDRRELNDNRFVSGCMKGDVVLWDCPTLSPIRHITPTNYFKTISRPCKVCIKNNILLCSIRSEFKLYDIRCNATEIHMYNVDGFINDILISGDNTCFVVSNNGIFKFDVANKSLSVVDMQFDGLPVSIDTIRHSGEDFINVVATSTGEFIKLDNSNEPVKKWQCQSNKELCSMRVVDDDYSVWHTNNADATVYWTKLI